MVQTTSIRYPGVASPSQGLDQFQQTRRLTSGPNSSVGTPDVNLPIVHYCVLPLVVFLKTAYGGPLVTEFQLDVLSRVARGSDKRPPKSFDKRVAHFCVGGPQTSHSHP
ncbi:hypothetical protein TNCV_4581301 [Trichonephila clavipes]|nr:hypothetical protein TNCV_4581301 [Trichonephila clavipes]